MKRILLIAAIMLSVAGNAQFAVEHFDAPWTGTPAAPLEWKVVNIGGAGITWEQSPVGSTEYPAFGNSGQAALLKIDPALPTNPLQEDWLITKPVVVPANPDLRFMSRMLQAGDQGSIYKVMIGTNPNDLSTFVPLYTATELQINPQQLIYTQRIIDIPQQYFGQSVYFAFVMAGSNADGWLVDDVRIVSNCLAPSNLSSVYNLSSAVLSWTENGAATSWQINIANAGAPVPQTGQTVTNNNSLVVAATFSGTPFAPGEFYQYYVRALCPDGGISEWVGPHYFPENPCPAPTNVMMVSSTLNTQVYSWTSAGEYSYEFLLTTQSEVPDASTIPSGIVVEPTVTLSALDPGVDYAFYVRTRCGPGLVSPWVTIAQEPVEPVNVVLGTVLYDSNSDGVCDGNDNPVSNTEIQVQVGDVSYSTYTNQNGSYAVTGLADGTHTLNLQVVSPVFSGIPPLVLDVIFDDEVNLVQANHCLEQPLEVNDLEVTLIATGQPRPGFNTYYNVIVRNNGGLPQENVVVNLSFDNNRISYITSSLTGAAAVAGNLSIPIGDLQPFETVSGSVLFNTMQPPVNMGGEELEFSAVLSAVEDDITPDNNTAVLNQIIVNSYDPNDITVHEGAEIYEEQADDYLTYTIRFQNTGTADAINIRLENTLDELLDWSTFRPIVSSHNYEVKRTNDLLEFEYKDINLADATSNEPESHGFVTYKIKPKTEYGLGDIVSNTAEIYFDFNPAIITNTATTEVVALAGLNENALSVAKLYPNPVKDKLFVEVTRGELSSVTVYDMNGRLCLTANEGIIDANLLNSGIYLVKVITDEGSANYKIIKY